MEELDITDKRAFALLYQKHVAELLQYSLRLTQDKELIKDVIQDTFVYLWQTRDKLNHIQSLKAYLITCVRREIIRRTKNSQATSHQPDAFPFTESPEDLLTRNQSRASTSKKVTEKVKRLPVRQQEVVFLRFYAGLDFGDISKIMNIRIRSVYKVLYKALHALKETVPADLLQ